MHTQRPGTGSGGQQYGNTDALVAALNTAAAATTETEVSDGGGGFQLLISCLSVINRFNSYFSAVLNAIPFLLISRYHLSAACLEPSQRIQPGHPALVAHELPQAQAKHIGGMGTKYRWEQTPDGEGGER